MRHPQVTSLESVRSSLILANIFWISAKVTTFLTMHFHCQGFVGCKEFGWTHLLYRISWVIITKDSLTDFYLWTETQNDLSKRKSYRAGSEGRKVFVDMFSFQGKKKMDNIFQKNVFYIPRMFALCKSWKFLDVYKVSHRHYLAGELQET